MKPYEPTPPTKQYHLTTTLRRLREHRACSEGYTKLTAHLGPEWPDDRSINLLTILESNGVEDCLWSFRAAIEEAAQVTRLIAADLAEHVLHVFEGKHPADQRPRMAIDVARAYVRGEATEEEMAAARDAAWAAEDAARDAARDAAWDAEDAARDAEREWQAAQIRMYLED